MENNFTSAQIYGFAILVFFGLFFFVADRHTTTVSDASRSFTYLQNYTVIGTGEGEERGRKDTLSIGVGANVERGGSISVSEIGSSCLYGCPSEQINFRLNELQLWQSSGGFPITFYTGGFEQMRVDGNGNVGLGTSAPTNKLDVNSDSIRIEKPKTPKASSDVCDVGTITWDTRYVYMCVAPNTWKRSALKSW